jgi:phosphoglycolate phosphatase-like HAD superfamily hydrolase
MTATPRLVVLFDIDGTLLHTMGAGIRGMNRAFDRLHGRPDALDGVPVAGRTDRSIVSDGFRRIGIAPDDDRIQELRRVYVDELPGELEQVAGRAPGVLPGVRETIAAFEGERGVAIGLLTGNFEVIAALKLDHYRLSGPFTFGGFGDRHLDRRDLLPMALARAARADIDARDARVVVIGDTPLDVDCAHAHGAAAVAVTTGQYSSSELEAAGADLVVDALGADVAAEIASSVLSPTRGTRR